MTPEEEIKKRINDLESYQKDIESRLLEQEHRPFTVIKNFLNRDKWDKQDKRRKSVKLAILWRLFFSPAAMAVTGGAIGLITIFLLFWQNKLLTTQNNLTIDQNKKFDYQNEKIIEQNNLIEAERRSAQVFVMSDVLQDLQKEITQKNRPKDSTISNILAGRIVAVSRAMKPYRILQADTLSDLISPERGQLLITLRNAGINNKQLNNKILNGGDFSYAELIDADLSNLNLEGVNLSYSDFRGVNFHNANLKYADLYRANLMGAFLDSSNLARTNLRDVDLSYAHLDDADLFGANLIGANLVRANLSHTNLTLANLTDVFLDSAIVHRKDWIGPIKDLVLTGGKQIDSLYIVESRINTDDTFQIVFKSKNKS